MSIAEKKANPIDIADYCRAKAQSAKQASRALATLPGETRNGVLRHLAKLLREEKESIQQANQLDLDAAPGFGLSSAAIDRLRLDDKRIEEMAVAVEEIVGLVDPVRRVLAGYRRPNGLDVKKVSVPLGVVFFIYESRPNVTTDAAALCIKSGNAVILRGGKEARNSNLAIGAIVGRALSEYHLPSDAVVVVEIPDREAVGEFLSLPQWIDVAIPRGGESLIRRVASEAKMPVIKHFEGICHVYVHRDADLEKAIAITENAKCQRPGTCNAAETLLIDADIAEKFLPAIAQRLIERQVELRGCPRTQQLVPQAIAARDADYHHEYLDNIMNVRVVSDIDQAITHVTLYGSAHTDAIITESLAAAEQFTSQVDSSAVMVNASTRFNDGGQLGLGAEIGISTDRFHARGPCGLDELMTYKWIVVGDGHLRK
ncbi:glutamate-5-semialdehyde dehydrogenase [bacterium]|nr:glutamate-5-semialdehyde dehydrogenase [bacterium]